MPQTNLQKARAKAAKLGVTVEPSRLKNKKIDVFNKAGDKVASVGDIRYSDFNQHADAKRRILYKARHEKHRHKIGTASYFADRLLW